MVNGGNEGNGNGNRRNGGNGNGGAGELVINVRGQTLLGPQGPKLKYGS